jgi:hypothetical protein
MISVAVFEKCDFWRQPRCDIPHKINVYQSWGNPFFAAARGADKAKVVITESFYNTSVNCTGRLDESYVATGKATASAATKNVSSGAKMGTANTAEVKFEGITISAGSFTIPALGAVAKVGYLIEAGKLYVLAGARKADGLPESFSRVAATKQ